MKKILYFILFFPFIGGVIASLLKFNKQEIKKFETIAQYCFYIYASICIILAIYETYRIINIEKQIREYPKKLDLYFAKNFKEVTSELKKDKKEAIYEIIFHTLLIAIVIYITKR